MVAELQAHVQMESWLRIVAAAVMFYDYLITIPSEIRLYQRQPSFTRPSFACIFFILSRYVGLAAVISATIVFFHGFRLESCTHVIYVVGATRSMLSTIVNLILLGRTWVIWGRNKWVAIGMGLALVPCTIFSYGYLFEQVPMVKAGACTALSGKTLLGQKWLFALVNMCYDTLACILCTIRLVRNIRAERAIVGMSSVLLGDGIGYFAIVMVGHALNFYFSRSSDAGKQGSFFTFNVALSSILSQKIITSLYERTSLKSSMTPSGSRGLAGGASGQGLPLSPLSPPSPFTPSRFPPSPSSSTYKNDKDRRLSANHHGIASLPISIGVEVETRLDGDPEKHMRPHHPYAVAH